MVINNRAFLSARNSSLASCLVLVSLTGCGWRGIHPVYEQIALSEQARRAIAIVFAEPVSSIGLRHRELVSTSPRRGPSTQYVAAEAVEKTLKIRQVLMGPIEAGSLLKVDTYEIKGVPGIVSQPAIFFLTRVGDAWTPFTDFGPNTIPLPGFPNRPLVLARVEPGSTSWISEDRVLINALLDSRNAGDWPMFKSVLSRLVKVSAGLAEASGLSRNDPAFINDRLAVLAFTANPDVSAAARKELVAITGFCHEVEPLSSQREADAARNDFLSGKIYGQLSKVPVDNEQLYWRLKAFSCSKSQRVSARAKTLLNQYFPGRRTISCEICAGENVATTQGRRE